MKPVGIDSVDVITRKQLEKIKACSPLQAAMLEWYRESDEETRRLIEAEVVQMAGMMRERCPTMFGVGMALELLGAVLADELGWRRNGGM